MEFSKTVKCVSCNIVINEVLAFISNKLDVMDNESLVQICATAFTVLEVNTAKLLLFDCIRSGKKNISRRGNGKVVMVKCNEI